MLTRLVVCFFFTELKQLVKSLEVDSELVFRRGKWGRTTCIRNIKIELMILSKYFRPSTYINALSFSFPLRESLNDIVTFLKKPGTYVYPADLVKNYSVFLFKKKFQLFD